jgi:hypothetical protein
MVSTCKIDIIKSGFFCDAELWCGGKNRKTTSALVDTGAGICHITYGLWVKIGFRDVCFEDLQKNAELFKSFGFKAAEDLTFDKLPLISKESELGDAQKVRVYEFRLDKLSLGIESIGNPERITLPNVTVRIMDSLKHRFIIGTNVLKYLAVQYNPSIGSAVCSLSLLDDGAKLFEHDRANGVSNCMHDTFSFIQDYDAYKQSLEHFS